MHNEMVITLYLDYITKQEKLTAVNFVNERVLCINIPLTARS